MRAYPGQIGMEQGKWASQVALSGKAPACQCRRQKRHEIDPWVGKIPWQSAWQTTPLSILPWRISWREAEGGLQSTESKSVRQDWSNLSAGKENRWSVSQVKWMTLWIIAYEVWEKGWTWEPLPDFQRGLPSRDQNTGRGESGRMPEKRDQFGTCCLWDVYTRWLHLPPPILQLQRRSSQSNKAVLPRLLTMPSSQSQWSLLSLSYSTSQHQLMQLTAPSSWLPWHTLALFSCWFSGFSFVSHLSAPPLLPEL